ncbi:peptidylprolyl isomerase [Sphingomonas naphthae]
MVAAGTLTAGIALIAGSQMAIAQQQAVPRQPGNSADALDLPTDLQVFGPRDPAIRKATAIVNGTIITDTDVDQRLALVIVANGGQVPDAERERLRLQILRNLIDETLQIQEAAAQDLKVSAAEIDQTFNRLASQFKRTPKDFATYLTSVGSSAASLKRQVEGETAWRRVLGRKVEPFVNVGEEEVKAIMARLNASKGAQEYRIGEIYLSDTPATAAQVRANADRIVEQVRQGGAFVAYARQYSEASTAAVGGDLGWVRLEQLPDELASAAREMNAGQISEPIQLAGGWSILAVIDKRQVLTADPRDSVLSLKQVSITFPKGTSQTAATGQVERFANMAREIKGCGSVADAAAKVGAEVVSSDGVAVRDLPAPLQDIMLKLNIGESSPPFGTVEDGVRTLVLCGRDEPAAASGPSFDQIYSQLEEERVNRRAQRYLRDLRRDAVIDYR